MLDECRRAGMWPQVWIVIRLISELLVSEGRYRPAAVLLAAADADGAGPDTTGDDADRLSGLGERIAEAIGSGEATMAASEGRSLDRNEVLEAAAAALDELA